MSLTLRPATPTDAGAVGAILSEFVDDTAWMPRIHTRAEDLAHAGDLITRGWVTVAETLRQELPQRIRVRLAASFSAITLWQIWRCSR